MYVLLMKISLKHLHVFSSIARNGSLSKAAEECCITQSALSMSLGEMEKQLGAKLFDRTGRRLVLNPLGWSLLPKALDVVERVQEIEDICAQKAEEVAGTLRVGASSTIGNYVVPGIIGDFVRQNAAARLLLDVGNTEHVKRELLHFNIDIGLIEGFCDHSHILMTPWITDRLVVFAAPDHPLAHMEQPQKKDVFSANWILRERGSGTRDVFERALKGDVAQLNLFLELGHTEAIKQAVEAGMGVSCLSIRAIQRSLEDGRVVEVPAPYWDFKRTFNLLIHKDKYQTRVLTEFFNYCQEWRVTNPLP